MRHKSVCPFCGRYAYLHSKVIDAYLYYKVINKGKGIILICDECDKPIEVRMTKGANND